MALSSLQIMTSLKVARRSQHLSECKKMMARSRSWTRSMKEVPPSSQVRRCWYHGMKPCCRDNLFFEIYTSGVEESMKRNIESEVSDTACKSESHPDYIRFTFAHGLIADEHIWLLFTILIAALLAHPHSSKCDVGYTHARGGGCVPCPPGTYWKPSKCVPCKSGTYSSVEASKECLPCIGGTIASQPGSTYCKPCNRGWYTDDGITCVFPTSAPSKSTIPKPSNSLTQNGTCNAGYTSKGKNCVPCPPGTFEQFGKCVPCKPGTFSSEAASTKCLLCTDFGSLVAPKSGSVTCDRCDRPFYTLDGINCLGPPTDMSASE